MVINMINMKFNMQRVKNSYDMPLINNIHKNTQIQCLLDTGARVPVWCAGKEELKSYYTDCYKQDAVFLLSGFGKGQEIADVYVMPDFELSNGKSAIHYKDLLIAVIDKDFSFNMILSYTMFNKMNVSINTFSSRNGAHNMIPNLKITSLKEMYNVRYKLADLSGYNQEIITQKYRTKNILDSIYIFNQQ
ncbi:MAG: hypothetical protein NC318_07515 [Blautia sp.]|nr:hypothetical protein [Muribaculaceae bacterium]MCM1145618.1 hypothetical protein [Lachnoclostridium sp.]MCM1211436.1 hypothetical protein [Blautia sp.]